MTLPDQHDALHTVGLKYYTQAKMTCLKVRVERFQCSLIF